MKNKAANVYLTIILFGAIIIAGLGNLFQYKITWVAITIYFAFLLLNIILTDRHNSKKDQETKE